MIRTNYPTREIGRAVDYERIKREGYRNQGLVIVSKDDPRLTWPERELVKALGDKLYGSERSETDFRPGMANGKR